MKKNRAKGLMKAAQQTIIPTLERGAGAIVAGYAANKLIPDFAPNIPTKAIGPAMMILGVGLEIMFPKNEHIKAVGQGVATYGVMNTAGEFIFPDAKADWGLAGVNDVVVVEERPQIDWAKVRNEPEMSGYGEDNHLEGVGDEDYYQNDLLALTNTGSGAGNPIPMTTSNRPVNVSPPPPPLSGIGRNEAEEAQIKAMLVS